MPQKEAGEEEKQQDRQGHPHQGKEECCECMHEGFAYGFARVRLIIKATLKLLWCNRRQRTKKYAKITLLQAESHIGTSITIQKVVLTAVRYLKTTSPFQTPCSTRQASLGIHIHARGICDRVPGIPLQLLIEHDSHAVLA